MKKIEKAMNLEAARVLLIEGGDLLDKALDKIEVVIGTIPVAWQKAYDNMEHIRWQLLREVVDQQEKLGIK